MSSTNKTTNYELSQFLGSDKPAWLSDYNTDMSKIDAQMKLNADAASTADGKGDTNAAAIGTLANLTTDAKTNLVAAINEVDGHADTAQGTASSAATTANGAKTTADGLVTYFTLSDKAKATVTVSGGTVGNINDVYYALNAAGTLGKVYGRYRYTVNTTGASSITIAVPGLTTSSQFTIASGCYYNSVDSGMFNIINARDLTVNTDGTITIEIPSGQAVGSSITIWLPPCLYFFTDFGDQPSPEA